MNSEIEKFLKEEKRNKEINNLAEHYPEKKSLVIDYEELEKFNPDLAEELLTSPDEIMGVFEAVLRDMNLPTIIKDPKFHVRFHNLPKEKGYTLMVRDITSDYIGRLISVEGIINKISDILPKVSVATFICNKCGERHYVPQSSQFLTEPISCDSCKMRDFRFIPNDSEWTDIQKLEIQELLELLEGGEEARRIEVWVEDDLTDAATAGDRIRITGMMRLKPPKQKGSVYFKK